MKFNGDAKRIKTKAVKPEDAELEKDLLFDKTASKNADSSPETDPPGSDDEEAAHKKNVRIGITIGVIIAALLLAAFFYHNQSGKIRNADISTTSTVSTSVKYGSLDGNDTGARTYRTDQLTVRQDENGVWRSYAGLEPTVGYTGVVGNDTGWWYVENDVVNFDFTGIADNDYGSWFVIKGKVQTNYSGKVVYKGQMYRVEKGKVTSVEPLTNKATTSTTSATTKAAETTVVPSSTATTTEATTAGAHDQHHVVVLYGGDPLQLTRIVPNRGYLKCADCGEYYATAADLYSHVYSNLDTHNPIEESEEGGPADKHIVSGADIQDQKVYKFDTYEPNVIGYYCIDCGKRVTDVDPTYFIE